MFGFLFFALLQVAVLAASSGRLDQQDDRQWVAQKLQSDITQVNPMKGLVLFHSHGNKPSRDALSLEFVSFPFSDVVKRKDVYDWSRVEKALNGIANSGHQAVLRFWYVSPGRPSGEPDYIKNMAKYPPRLMRNPSEGMVQYTNWASPEIKQFNSEFYRKLAAKYDGDKRIAFLQVGFGHWSEYHIWDLKYNFGVNFPDYAYQTAFLKEVDTLFKVTPWQVSVDIADAEFMPSPVFINTELLRLRFGCFLDSLLCGDPCRQQNNAKMMILRYDDRYMVAPMGGEIVYEARVQPNSLSWKGPNFGESIDVVARRDHLTYSLANDALSLKNNNGLGSFQAKAARFKEVGTAMGYIFVVESYHVNSATSESHVVVANNGTAPAYYDMFVAVGGRRAEESLKGLLPGERKGFYVCGVAGGAVTIVSDHITDKQVIQFKADAKGTEPFTHPAVNEMQSRYAYFQK